ncbi:MAG: hypothetical protein FWD38_07655 [Oscillospiraceae bacterium]|nr:hypothetical protein [Oscillospiraceae bacterium]
MSGISKNLLLGFTLVCVIVLIVFCIQLIVINSGVDRNQPGSVSGAGQGDADESPDGEEEDGDEVGAIPTPTPRPLPQGTRYELIISDNNRLIIYARDEFFDYEEEGLSWLFRYSAGGNAVLDISFTMFTVAQSAADQAVAFLNRYSGGTEAVYVGEIVIPGSSIYGYHATARHGEENYEVWIHEPADSDIALAFVIRYENDQQKDALYEVLSTLDIVRIGEPVTPPPDHGLDGSGFDGLGTDGTDDGGTNDVD